MNAGEPRSVREVLPMDAGADAKRRWLIGSMLTLPWARRAAAIDDPDAPDRLAQFAVRAKPFEDKLAATSGGSASARAGADYLAFLDRELNGAYRSLEAHLPADAKAKLLESQRLWILFRDAEGRFVEANWTEAGFGSSASLSRADYRATLVRQRVTVLLGYLQNYAGS